jgi:hypothetical protein
MNKKSILSFILTIAIIIGIFTLILKYSAVNQDKSDIKIMTDTESNSPTTLKDETKINATAVSQKDGFQIEKYENIACVEWLNKNKVLTLTKKSELINPDSTQNIYFCSIYNLNNKKSTDFKEANINQVLGVSPDKNYVLYSEARVIPKVDSDEWKQEYDSGELFHENIKLLNLSSGEISDLVTDKKNHEAEFKWISADKLMVNYYDKWQIINLSSEVLLEGTYNNDKSSTIHLSGVQGIKDLENGLEGKFYFTNQSVLNQDGSIGIIIYSYDIKTNEVKQVYSSKNSITADQIGDLIVMDTYNNNGAKSTDGIYHNRTFGNTIIDLDGKLIKDINLPKGRIMTNSVVSPDGTKAVYIESTAPTDSDGKENEIVIKLIDIETGEITEVIKESQIKEKSLSSLDNYNLEVNRISNICWNNTNNIMSFNFQSSKDDTDTYVVNFNK